jgi:hypothetical protein
MRTDGDGYSLYVYNISFRAKDSHKSVGPQFIVIFHVLFHWGMVSQFSEWESEIFFSVKLYQKDL